ncbi:hypothetical protein B0H13DRAFT_2342847 [Mycena leptocephala]|nr:hypothetical protein B0H13DRAFT_2342847 [Mycena leptocephala]
MMWDLELWYYPESPMKGKTKQGDGEVKVGKGSERSFELELADGQSSSTGFLKLFMATEHLEIDWIKQNTSCFKEDPLWSIPHWDAPMVVLTMTKDWQTGAKEPGPDGTPSPTEARRIVDEPVEEDETNGVLAVEPPNVIQETANRWDRTRMGHSQMRRTELAMPPVLLKRTKLLPYSKWTGLRASLSARLPRHPNLGTLS